jgi:hypothetical protein
MFASEVNRSTQPYNQLTLSDIFTVSSRLINTGTVALRWRRSKDRCSSSEPWSNSGPLSSWMRSLSSRSTSTLLREGVVAAVMKMSWRIPAISSRRKRKAGPFGAFWGLQKSPRFFWRPARRL